MRLDKRQMHYNSLSDAVVVLLHGDETKSHITAERSQRRLRIDLTDFAGSVTAGGLRVLSLQPSVLSLRVEEQDNVILVGGIIFAR